MHVVRPALRPVVWLSYQCSVFRSACWRFLKVLRVRELICCAKHATLSAPTEGVKDVVDDDVHFDAWWQHLH